MSESEATAAQGPHARPPSSEPTWRGMSVSALALVLAMGAGAGGLTGFLAGSLSGPSSTDASNDADDAGGLLALSQRAREVAVDTDAQADRRALAFGQLALFDPPAASAAAVTLAADPATPDALRFAALRTYETPADGDDAAMIAAVLDGLAAEDAALEGELLAAHQAFFAARDSADLPAVTAWFEGRETDDAFERAAEAALAMDEGAFLPVLAAWADEEDAALSELAWARFQSLAPDAPLGDAGRRDALAALIPAIEGLIARGPQPAERDIAGVPESFAREIYTAITVGDVAALSRLRMSAGDYDNLQLGLLFDYLFSGGQPTAFDVQQLGYELPNFEALATFLEGGYGGPAATADPYLPYQTALSAMMRAEPADWRETIAPALRNLSDTREGREAASLVVAAWLERLASAENDELLDDTLAFAGENPEAFSDPTAFRRLAAAVTERAGADPESAFEVAPAFFRAAYAAEQVDAFDTVIQSALIAALAALETATDGPGLATLRDAALAAEMSPAQRAGFNSSLARTGLAAFAPEAVAYIYEAPSLERAVAQIVVQAREGRVEARRVAAIDLLRAMVEGAGEAGAGFSTPLEAADLATYEIRPIELGVDTGEGPSARERDRADDLRAAAAREFDWPERFRDIAVELDAGAEIPLETLSDDNGSYWFHIPGVTNAIAGLDIDGQVAATMVVSEDGEVLSGHVPDQTTETDASVLAPATSAGRGAYVRITPRDAAEGLTARHASSPVLDLRSATRRVAAIPVEPGVVYALDTAATEVDRGWVRLVAEEDATFIISTFDLDDQADTTLEAFAAESAESVARNDDGGEGLASRLTILANAGDAFDIAISHFARNLGAFRFTIEQRPPMVVLSQATDRSAAIALSAENEHAVDSRGVEGGWIRFTAAQDAAYEIETYDLVDVDTTLTGYSGENEIGYDDDGGEGLASRLEIQGEAGRDYHVLVGHFAGNTTGGQFTLRIRRLADATDFSAIANRAAPLALVADAPVHLRSEETVRTGWASFTAPAAGRYEFVTQGLSQGVDTALTVFRDDQNVNAGTNDDVAGDLGSRVVVEAEAGERLVVRVDDTGWAGGGRFELLVRALP